MRVHPPRSPPFPYTTLFRSRAYALRFAREGAHVVVADIRDEQARAVAAECQALGPAALGARLDVADEASTRALAEATIERFGHIDILVNNAAIYYDLDRTENTLAYFNRVLSVNLTGAWLMSRAVERFMKRQRKGKVIHQSSTAAYLGNVGMVDTDDPEKPMPPFHYSVAKIGVAGRADCSGPPVRHVCRAGFAGRGTAFARSTERRTLASDSDPRQGLGSLWKPALERPRRHHPDVILVEPGAGLAEAVQEVGRAVVVWPVGGERDVVGGQELERDLQVDLLARLDRHHHLSLEDLHRRRLPFGRLDAPERLAVLLEALEHRREPADTGLEDHGGHGREAIEHPARHHVVERVHHVHGEAEAGRGHDVGQLVALRRPVLVPHGEGMEAELHARVDDRLPERGEGAVRVLPPEHRIGADEHRRAAALGDPVHLGDRGLDVYRAQGRDRDEP